MDIQQTHQYFDLIFDKVGSPYLTSDEKDLFLQRGQIDFVNSFFRNVKGKYNAEEHSYDDSRIYPLIETVEVTADEDGMLFYTDINSQLTTGSFMYVLKILQENASTDTCNTSISDFSYSQWVSHNNVGPRLNLSFKTPQDIPMHVYENTFLQLYPEAEKKARVTVLRTPALITLDDAGNTGTAGPSAIDWDLPEKVRNEIVMLAIRQSAINTKDTELYQFVQAQQNEIT
jgi:hypothetical protein